MFNGNNNILIKLILFQNLKHFNNTSILFFFNLKTNYL